MTHEHLPLWSTVWPREGHYQHISVCRCGAVQITALDEQSGPEPLPLQSEWLEPDGVGTLTVSYVAQITGLSTSAVRQAIQRGRLPATKATGGGDWLISRADLNAYLA